MAARTRAALLLLLCASATLASDDGQCTAPPPAPAAAAPAASILNTTVFMAEVQRPEWSASLEAVSLTLPPRSAPAQMSWYEYAKRVAAGVTVILPVGSTEQARSRGRFTHSRIAASATCCIVAAALPALRIHAPPPRSKLSRHRSSSDFHITRRLTHHLTRPGCPRSTAPTCR